MRMRSWARNVTMAAGVVVVATTLSGCTPAQPTIIKSKWETAAANRDYARDGGYSAPMPDLPGLAGQSMWLWGDTATVGSPWPSVGTHASVGPSTVSPFPDVSEISTPGVFPADGADIVLGNSNPTQRFLANPGPEELRLPGNSAACSQPDTSQGITGSLPIRWPLGLARGPGGGATITLNGTPRTAAHLMFVSFADVCLMSHPTPPEVTITVQRYGIAVYDPVTNQILELQILFGATPDGSNLPWQQWLFHPTFVGTDVYFYGVCNPAIDLEDACPETIGKVAQARVSLANVLNGAQYQWKTATGWSSNPANATTIVPVDAAHQPWSVYVGDFSHISRGWLMVVATSGDGDVRIYQAPSATGPWTQKIEGKTQGCPEYADPTLLKCYHLWGHPELSTAQDLILSYHAQHPNGGENETYLVSLGTLIPPLP